MKTHALVTLLAAGSLSGMVLGQNPARVDFRRDVRPIFEQHCVSCHGPTQQMNGLRLDRRREAMRPAAGGTLIGPGNSVGSRLFLRLIGTQYGLQMPPDGPLSPDEVNIIKTWIDQGAEWPDDLSGEKRPAVPDAMATRLMNALRAGDRQTFDKLLRDDPNAGARQGPGGSTPLMFAALYGDTTSVRRLLESGADPNTKNDAGATALMLAVDDLEKTRLLLAARGTDPNARSDERYTPLIAAGRFRSDAVVELLLDRGATLSAAAPGDPTLLAGLEPYDPALLRSLFKRGIEPKNLPAGVLNNAILADCDACVDLLIQSASRNTLNGALITAARSGKTQAMAVLLDHGADPNTKGATGIVQGLTPLLLAAASESIPAEAVKTLIERGADINARSANGETALDLAKRHGQTRVVEILVKAGVKDTDISSPSAAKPKPAASVRLAIERSIPLLQRSDVTFLRKSGCVSCHNNSLTAMAIASARTHGIRVDEHIARQQLSRTASYVEASRELFLGGAGVPGGYDTTVYILAGMAAEKYPPDLATDAMARSVKNQQSPDGRWRIRTTRPPIESSDFQVTANAMRALLAYAPPSLRNDYEHAVQRGAAWLAGAQPNTTEDRVYQVLGLQWAGGYKDRVRRAARELLAQQRPDGGWAQLPSLTSDAYATGQVLVALNEAGGLSVTDAAYKRGITFLLNTQFDDGSWHVRTRTLPLQPYFESDFPWGRDQFISAAATNWAVMALAPASR